MNTKNCSSHTKKYKTLISAIHSIYRLVNSTFETNELVCRLSRLLCQIFNAYSCLIVVVDPSKKYSDFKCLVSGNKKLVYDKKTKITNSLEKKIIRTFCGIRKDTLMGLPMVCEDLTAIVFVRRKKGGLAFDHFEQQLLSTVLEQASIALRNLQLYEEQQRIVLGSIKSMVTLLDTRIPQEYTHSSYFSRIVEAIAVEMHMEHKQVESLKYASLLHDAGKVDIPLAILTKTTKLTPQEYKIIRSHPIRGAAILRPLQVLKPVIPIIMHHHEKYDGTGYPSRLKKGQIPQSARIMAVADAFEAMVYGRPYRERKEIHEAIREIRSKSGTQFDPKVVEAFLRIVKKLNLKIYLQDNSQRKDGQGK